jgi:hypothetical protein
MERSMAQDYTSIQVVINTMVNGEMEKNLGKVCLSI